MPNYVVPTFQKVAAPSLVEAHVIARDASLDLEVLYIGEPICIDGMKEQEVKSWMRGYEESKSEELEAPGEDDLVLVVTMMYCLGSLRVKHFQNVAPRPPEELAGRLILLARKVYGVGSDDYVA